MKYICICITAILLSACKKDPRIEMPSIRLLLADSSTYINTTSISKDQRTMLVHFESECLGCQKETAAILKNIEVFRDIRLVFITTQNMKELKIFSNYYKFNKYPNIIAGLDYESTFPKHFDTHLTPYVAIYNKKQKLEGIIEGGGDINRIINKIKDPRSN